MTTIDRLIQEARQHLRQVDECHDLCACTDELVAAVRALTSALDQLNRAVASSIAQLEQKEVK